MSNNLIESFLKYEEQRKAQKNPNEFQNVKNLHGETAISEQGPPVSAMARPGDTRFGKFNSDGTVRGSFVTGNATAARAGVRTEPRATIPSTGDSVRDSVNAGNSMSTPRAEMAVTNSGGDQVSVIPGRTPDGRPLTQGQGEDGQRMMGPEPEVKSSTGGSRSLNNPAETTPTPSPETTPTPSPETTPTPSPETTPTPSSETTPTPSTGRTSATSTHTVSSGDNLSTLAQRNNLSVRDIMAANPDITDPHKIRVGQSIRIPRSLAAPDKKIYAGGVGAGGPTNESIEFTEAELAHFRSILEAMPVAPTAEGHGPNPTPKNKAEGGKGRGSLSEKMDPVGEEDKDVNNDGEENTDSDKYLRRRRDAIADNMKKKK